MSADAAESLRRLMAALVEHLEAVEMRRGDADAAVDDAYDAIAAAFERYEELLDTEYGESLPLVLDDTDGDDFDDDDADEVVDDDVIGLDPDEEDDDEIEEFDLR